MRPGVGCVQILSPCKPRCVGHGRHAAAFAAFRGPHWTAAAWPLSALADSPIRSTLTRKHATLQIAQVQVSTELLEVSGPECPRIEGFNPKTVLPKNCLKFARHRPPAAGPPPAIAATGSAAIAGATALRAAACRRALVNSARRRRRPGGPDYNCTSGCNDVLRRFVRIEITSAAGTQCEEYR